MMMLRILLLKKVHCAVLLFAVLSCSQKKEKSSPYAHLSDPEVAAVLKKGIDWAGGMDRWQELTSIVYDKHSVLLLEDSTIENETFQKHSYVMQPTFSADISWTKDSVQHQIQMNERARKIENDSVVGEGAKVAQSVYSSLYVLGMPWKLLDGGVHLKLEEDVVIKGEKAFTIKAEYSPAENENHSTSDVWWYYFRKTDGAFMGCLVYHAPTFAYIENLEFHNVEGMKFHKHRKSYRSDENRNIQFLRAEFWYEDYQLSFQESTSE